MTLFYKTLFFTTLISGTLISISSNSWLGVWMGLEMNLLSFIPLLNNSKSPRSTEASLKYFISQAVASMILLMAMLIDSNQSSVPSNLMTSTLTFTLMTTALMIKMGAAPMHYWFPEVMEGINWLNALLLLTWQKIAPMASIMFTYKNENIMTIMILTSIMTGSLMGLNQTSMRKILSYSSINHIGWMLASMLFMETLWKWYFLVYSVMNISIVLMLEIFNISTISQLISFSSIFPKVKIFFVLNFMSLGGLPPFIGFMPKWFTIQALTLNGMYPMALAIIVMTLVTLYFYMRMVMPPASLTISSYLNLSASKSLKNKPLTLFNFILMSSLTLSTLALNWT